MPKAKKEKTVAKEPETEITIPKEKTEEIIKTLPVIEPVQVPLNFKSKITRAQVEIIKTQIAKGATDDELKMFLYVCERTGLDPFTKQVHLVPRWDGRLGKEVRSVIVGIDGLRSVAERTGAYAGNSDPIMGETRTVTYKEGQIDKVMDVPTTATVTVKKVVQGVICDFTATAKWDEYYPGDKQGMMWRKMPDNMLGKCAEAKALRKAFPAVMSGLYVAEEMQQAQLDPKEIEIARQNALFRSTRNAIIAANPETALTYRDKIESSDKYTSEQKAELLKLVDDKQQSADADQTQKDDTPTVPIS